MNADLDSPLGQEQGKNGRLQRSSRLVPLLGVSTALGLLTLSLYTALSPLPLSDGRTIVETAEQVTPPDTVAAQTRSDRRASTSQSGARVERQTLADGSSVTKFSPLPRDDDGPVLIEVPRIGQDPRTAAFPNEDLLEDSSHGPLPVVGPDGTRPVEQYARPWSGARGTRIAIVIGGLGLSQTGTQNALRALPPEITLGFAAAGNSLQRWMQEARRGGHEILLQVPFEPFDYPSNNPGRGTLLTGAKTTENLDHLHKAMATITNYTGIMNYMGGKFLSDGEALEPIMRDIADRGLLFLDDGSTAGTLSQEYAEAMGAPHAFADLQIDGQLDETTILKRLDELERIAHRQGHAIGVGSAFEETVGAVRKWSDEAMLRGIEIVGVSALAADIRP